MNNKLRIFNFIFLFVFTYLCLYSPKIVFNSSDIELIKSDHYYNELTLLFTSFILFFSQVFFIFSGAVFILLILISLSLRYGEIYHYKIFGFGYEPISFSHFNKNSITLFFDSYLNYFLIFLLIFIFLILFSLKFKIKNNYFFMFILLIFLIRGSYLIHTWGGFSENSKNRIYSSEISIISALFRYHKSYNFVINKEEISILNSNYSKNETKKIEKRNIFLIYLESFSYKFLSETLTPNIYEFSKNSIVFKNYYNSSALTINALISSQCGIYPKLGYNNTTSYQVNVERYNSLNCLGDIIKNNGYYLMYLQAADKSFSSKDIFLKNHGFDIIYGRNEIKEIYKEIYDQESNFWGIYDRQLFEIATKELPKLKDKSPFLFSLININTHSPGYFSKECPYRLKDQLVNAIKCTDFYLGKYLLEVKYFFPDSIILLLGDHVGGPNNLARKYVEDEKLNSAYDKTLLIINDPNLKKQIVINETISVTPDLYPTILEILGGDDGHINFGKSLFSDRIHDQNIITPEFQLGPNISDFPNGISFDDCFEEKPISNKIIHNCTRKRIFNYAEKLLFPL